MEKLALTQKFMICYISCGIYEKVDKDIKKLQEIITEDIKGIANGKTFEEVFQERKKNINIPIPIAKKMPCGAHEKDENHYPILKCEYCNHKFTESSISGFC